MRKAIKLVENQESNFDYNKYFKNKITFHSQVIAFITKQFGDMYVLQ